jgi:uncharacterized protein YjbJ (UPF0337 family)
MVDRNRIEGAGDKAKGSMKEAAGKLTGDAKLKAEGKMDKAKGSVKNAAGGTADKMREKDRDRRM